MRIPIALLLLICVSVTPCKAGTDPSVTTQVSIVDGLKQYVYTLTNDTDSATPIRNINLWMPRSAAASVISFTCSKPNWSKGIVSFRDDIGVWRVGAGVGANLVYGEQAVFTLTTPASVPTSYTFRAPIDEYPSNWQWNTTFGTSIVPVPVPEPSSILALTGGIAGLGGLVVRRRRS